MTTISNNKLPEWRKALNSAVENYQSTQAWYEENPDNPPAEQDMDAAEGDIEKLLKQYGVLIVLSLMDEIDELQELHRSCLALRGEIEDVQEQLYEAENRNNADDEELQERRKADSAEPLAWTDEEELRDLRKVGFCEMFSVAPISKDADMLRVIPLYRHAQPVPERERIRREHAEWSDATFGDVGPIGPLKHLSKEALEAAAEPDDLSEWADMQFLLWDAQRRAGISDEQITQAMVEKLAVNKQREWPEPKDGEPRLHIKELPAPMAMNELLPCPFCGGKAHQLTIERDDDPHFGGDVITCTECGASSHVEFGFKENLKSAWNSRAAMLKTEPATAPVMPAELHPDTQNLAANFCTALAEKLYKAQLKYGYDADWKQDGWSTQCQAHFHQHIAKGDPRDVAAYCAFMWYHGWKTESVSGPVVPDDQADAFIAAIEKEQDRLHEEDYLMDSKDCIDVIREEVQRLNACRAALLQSEYRDLSQPVDPQISEYEKIMLRAGWVMVPVEPTSEMINAALKSHLIVFNPVETYSVMLAAAPQPEASDGK
ncbi:Lar family restriction alleviation protein [Salmonella enterica]|nr:Lar family restriction alleviation protein [Salmonella enterica]EKB5506509.1 Lar family restriction alleviation protein [Salmonella enterica]EKC2470748.1 Lar family restriction alleviation protein [Salmonella enterica]EKC2485114.1 Lar family restriction alleviation protein [Salmonella enterica]EKC2513845.1 Lar family restriction alleviation protein [Salmonella enterica]